MISEWQRGVVDRLHWYQHESVVKDALIEEPVYYINHDYVGEDCVENVN